MLRIGGFRGAWRGALSHGRLLCSYETESKLRNRVYILVGKAKGDQLKLSQAWKLLADWGCPKNMFLDQVVKENGVRTALHFICAEPILDGFQSPDLDVFHKLLNTAIAQKESSLMIIEIAEAAIAAGVDVSEKVKDKLRDLTTVESAAEELVPLFRFVRSQGWFNGMVDDLYHKSIELHVRSSDVKGAKETIADARKDGLEDVSLPYMMMIANAKMRGEHDVAKDLIQEGKSMSDFSDADLVRVEEEELRTKNINNRWNDRRATMLRKLKGTEAKDLGRGLDLARKMKPASFSAVLYSLIKKRDFMAARALYKNLHYGKGWIPDYCASNYILDVLAKTHDFDEAIYFFRMVQKEGVDKRLVSCRWYEHVFQACIYCGKFEMVETLFTEMLERGTLPGLGTFNHLATAYGKMGRAEDIEKLMVTMSEVGVTPQHIIYKVLMLTYIRAGRNREALEVVQNMMKTGIEMDPYALSAIMMAFINQYSAENAVTIFQNLCQGPDASVTPNLPLYTLFVKACKKSGQTQMVFEVFDDILAQKIDIDERLLTEVVDTFRKSPFDERFMKIFGAIQRMRVGGNFAFLLRTFNVLLSGDKCEEAMVILERMLARRKLPAMVHIERLFKSLAANKRISLAEELIVLLATVGETPSMDCFTSVIKAAASSHGVGRALGWVDRMETTGLMADTELYSIILSSADNFDDAQHVLRRLQSRGIDCTEQMKEIIANKFSVSIQPEISPYLIAKDTKWETVEAEHKS